MEITVSLSTQTITVWCSHILGIILPIISAGIEQDRDERPVFRLPRQVATQAEAAVPLHQQLNVFHHSVVGGNSVPMSARDFRVSESGLFSQEPVILANMILASPHYFDYVVKFAGAARQQIPDYAFRIVVQDDPTGW